jgi:hypothetical protein
MLLPMPELESYTALSGLLKRSPDAPIERLDEYGLLFATTALAIYTCPVELIVSSSFTRMEHARK